MNRNEKSSTRFPWRIGSRAAHALAPLWILLLAGSTLLGSGVLREEYRRSFSKTVPLPSPKSLRIDHRLGDVEITVHSQATVDIEAEIRVSADRREAAVRFADEIKIEISEGAGEVVVHTHYPGQDDRRGSIHFRNNLSFSVDYRIKMPRTAPLNVKTAFGDVSLDGLQAAATINNSNGNVVTRNTSKSLHVDNRFGALTSESHNGDAELGNSNGAVSVNGIGGSLSITNRFGNITASSIKGTVLINGSNGGVSLSDSGAATIESSFGTVETTDIHGSLRTKNRNGRVVAKRIQGPADLETSFAPVEFEDVESIDVVASNSEVEGRVVRQSASIRTNFGAVRLEQVGGGATVVNSNGAIFVGNIGGNADVRTVFGDVEATGVKGRVDVGNSNGKVTITQSAGPSKITTRFGSVSVSQLGGSVEVSASNSAIGLSDIQGNGTVKTNFGQIKVTKISGGLQVDNDNGGVIVKGVGSDLRVKTRFGPVTVEGAAGSVTVDNQNGSVEVRGLPSGQCRPIDLRTTFSTLRITPAQGVGYDVSASTSFGKIRSDYSLTVNGVISETKLNGTLGQGGCRLLLTNQNGSIEILK